jgi:hypothetical protein
MLIVLVFWMRSRWIAEYWERSGSRLVIGIASDESTVRLSVAKGSGGETRWKYQERVA